MVTTHWEQKLPNIELMVTRQRTDTQTVTSHREQKLPNMELMVTRQRTDTQTVTSQREQKFPSIELMVTTYHARKFHTGPVKELMAAKR